MDLVNLDLFKINCPACGQQVEAVARDGRVEGYCAVAKKRVDFLVKTKLERKDYRQDPEYRAKLRAATKKIWQNPDYRAKQKAALKKKGVGTSSIQ